MKQREIYRGWLIEVERGFLWHYWHVWFDGVYVHGFTLWGADAIRIAKECIDREIRQGT